MRQSSQKQPPQRVAMETTEALGRLEYGEKEMEVKDQSAQTREGRTHRRALGCEQMR